MTGQQLRERIAAALEDQGFRLRDDRILPPADLDKDKVRVLHAMAIRHRIETAREGLRHHEGTLLQRIAAGREVEPSRVAPSLIEVRPESDDELLFRYASLHWSIPVSSGYGRRLRFLVVDEHNGKLIGLFGLGDPVFALASRDQWIGWDKEARRQRLHHVADAFVLGAVPPYSALLGGKLVAMLVACSEVREAFMSKYTKRESVILQRRLDGQLALITTTSALGRSSIYNRITLPGRLLYHSVGFTRGSGEFHFSNGTYAEISRFVEENCQPTAKQQRWGKGFRNRREVVRKCLAALDLPAEWIYHGVQREVFVLPLARNTQEFLRGEENKLVCFNDPAQQIFAWFRERWLLPRAKRDRRYREFIPSSYALWNGTE